MYIYLSFLLLIYKFLASELFELSSYKFWKYKIIFRFPYVFVIFKKIANLLIKLLISKESVVFIFRIFPSLNVFIISVETEIWISTEICIGEMAYVISEGKIYILIRKHFDVKMSFIYKFKYLLYLEMLLDY